MVEILLSLFLVILATIWFIYKWFSCKDVTLVIRNRLQHPFFEEECRLRTRSKFLFDMMQEAADKDQRFRFTVKYFGQPLGFFVEGINDLFGNYDSDKTFWEILGGNNQQTNLGVSSYKPKDGEKVTFNFTRGECPE